jgi:hypothetical protein
MRQSSPARPLGCARLALPGLVVAVASFCARAQPPSTVPPDGLRDNTPAVHALVNARLVLAPGRTIEKGTVVVRDGAIVAVGSSADVTPPADARVWDLSGSTVYPGLIDAYGELGDGAGRTTGTSSGAAPAGAGTGPELLRPISGGAAYWNARVTPQFRADQQYRPDRDANKKLRGQGIVARLVAPPRQVIKGTSAAVTTGDGDATRAVLRPVVAMHLQLTPAGTPGTERAYPVSPMGAAASADRPATPGSGPTPSWQRPVRARGGAGSVGGLRAPGYYAVRCRRLAKSGESRRLMSSVRTSCGSAVGGASLRSPALSSASARTSSSPRPRTRSSRWARSWC